MTVLSRLPTTARLLLVLLGVGLLDTRVKRRTRQVEG